MKNGIIIIASTSEFIDVMTGVWGVVPVEFEFDFSEGCFEEDISTFFERGKEGGGGEGEGEREGRERGREREKERKREKKREKEKGKGERGE